MHRRDFLKLSGLLPSVLFVEFSPFAQLTSRLMTAESLGKLYRGTFDGKISVSEDQGQTWDLHANLGDQYTILGLFTLVDGQVYAEVWFQSQQFHLTLTPNGRAWQTVPRSGALAPG